MYGMRIVLIGRGLVGWHTDTVGEPNEDSPWQYTTTGSGSGGTLEGYAKEAQDGTPVYDASCGDVSAFTSFVFGGPIVKASLPPGQIQRFSEDDKKCLTHMMTPGGLGGDFRTLGAMALAGLSSLDYVSVDVYLSLLKDKVPGVKFGKVEKGEVVWT
jgi:hypothetical protein